MVVLGNIYNGVATDIGRDLAANTLSRDYQRPRFSKVRPDPDLVVELVGTCQFGPNFYVPDGTISFFEKDGLLFSDWGWMMPEGGMQFRDRTYWTQMEFLRDASGEVTAVRVDEHRGEKKPVP